MLKCKLASLFNFIIFQINLRSYRINFLEFKLKRKSNSNIHIFLLSSKTLLMMFYIWKANLSEILVTIIYKILHFKSKPVIIIIK